jgi:hypothetical protein
MNYKLNLCFITLLLLLAVNIPYAEAPDTLWSMKYPSLSEAYSVGQTSDNGYILTGYETGRTPALCGIFLLRVGPNGDTIWIRDLKGAVGYSAQETSDGGFIIIGTSRLSRQRSVDVFIIKVDSLGTLEWSRNVGGEKQEEGRSIQQTSDSGYIATGWTSSYGSGEIDVYLVRLNHKGDELWTRRIGGDKDDRGYSVKQTYDGGFVVAGETESYAEYETDIFLFKVDSNGEPKWGRTYGGRVDDCCAYSVQQTSDSGFIVVGEVETLGEKGVSAYILRTDMNGDTVWTLRYGNVKTARSVQETQEGGFVIAGAIFRGIYLMKISSDGQILWVKKHMKEWENFTCNSLQQTTDKGFIVCGSVSETGYIANQDIYLLKFSPE